MLEFLHRSAEHLHVRGINEEGSFGLCEQNELEFEALGIPCLYATNKVYKVRRLRFRVRVYGAAELLDSSLQGRGSLPDCALKPVFHETSRVHFARPLATDFFSFTSPEQPQFVQLALNPISQSRCLTGADA